MGIISNEVLSNYFHVVFSNFKSILSLQSWFISGKDICKIIEHL